MLRVVKSEMVADRAEDFTLRNLGLLAELIADSAQGKCRFEQQVRDRGTMHEEDVLITFMEADNPDGEVGTSIRVSEGQSITGGLPLQRQCVNLMNPADMGLKAWMVARALNAAA